MKFLVVFAYFCGSLVWAADCNSIKSYQDLIQCAELRSPELQRAQLEVERARFGIKNAEQWKNPELSAETFQGKVNGESRSETDISLAVPIEWWKTSSRSSAAEGEAEVAEAKWLEARANLKRDIFLKLHRLRQVVHEQELLEEAIGTFSHLVGQYAKRPGLSPEQQISASVYQLAKSEYELKQVTLIEERSALEAYFTVLGISASEVHKGLPSSPRAWPKAPAKGVGLSIQQKIRLAEVKSAQAELSLARQEAWPSFTLGPSVKLLQEGGQNHQLMGLNLSFPLPVFNWNGGGRGVASSALKLSQARAEFGQREQDIRRDELVKIYNQSVSVLSKSLSHEDIEKRHADSETLFKRGVVPSALVIESHRTSIELEKARHEREMKAFEALLDIQILDGILLETPL